MQGISGRRSKNYLGKTGYVYGSLFQRVVRDLCSPQFNIVLWRNRNIRMHIILKVTAMKFGPPF